MRRLSEAKIASAPQPSLGDSFLAKAARSRTTPASKKNRTDAPAVVSAQPITSKSDDADQTVSSKAVAQPTQEQEKNNVVRRASPRKKRSVSEAISEPASEKTSESTPESTPESASEAEGQTTAPYPFQVFYFDSSWYLATYPDVGACGMNAVEHFMTHGYLEGRDPNGYFSVKEYMAANPDISLTINPFLHFIMHGASEGRRLRP